MVVREVAPRGEKRPGVEIRRAPWVRVVRVADTRVTGLERMFDIDPGEAAVIAVAEEDAARSILLMDDRRGRAVARDRGLALLRTGALLVRAAEEKLLTESEVAAAVATLQMEHYLSDQAATDILALLRSRRR